MRIVTIVIVHALVLPGHATELKVNATMDTSVDMIDNLADRLVDRLVGKGLGFSRARAQPFTSFPGVKNAQTFAALPGPPLLKNKLLNQMQTTNRRCMAMKAVEKQEAADWIGNWKAKQGLASEASMKYLSKEEVESMAGVSGPFGLFDPFGIATNVPEGRLLFYREAELKHGRVCMLAIIGLIVAERGDFLPFLSDGAPPNTPGYLWATPFVQETTVAKFWPFALLLLFAEEWRTVSVLNLDLFGLKKISGIPGDYGFDPLGIAPKDPESFKQLQTKELNNGRLAMFAAAGIIAQEQYNNANIFR